MYPDAPAAAASLFNRLESNWLTTTIRVAGNSGPLPNETDWASVTRQSGSSDNIVEHTSVTKAVRRVGRFDSEVVRRAILVNRPTAIVLNHLDYISAAPRSEMDLDPRCSAFIATVERSICARITHLGFGPASLAMRK